MLRLVSVLLLLLQMKGCPSLPLFLSLSLPLVVRKVRHANPRIADSPTWTNQKICQPM